ncbi:MAG: hypothetical protein EBR79_01400 [Proteobacteria bacterium]|nr:hypothetical protein [Pseudomonadota bacterium]NBX86666.1 hypothetical protein [Pseudomonadota bacterium]
MTHDEIVTANLKLADVARAAADAAVYGPPEPPVTVQESVDDFRHISGPLANVLKELRRKMLANQAAGLL